MIAKFGLGRFGLVEVEMSCIVELEALKDWLLVIDSVDM
jgi:hypothetical protein